jgi:hypothetical protein
MRLTLPQSPAHPKHHILWVVETSLIPSSLRPGLESFYVHRDPFVKEAAVGVAASVVVLFPEIFISDNNLEVVWNLFFILGDREGQTDLRRDAVCRALARLAPIFVPAERPLALRIVQRLMSLPNLTAKEVGARAVPALGCRL